MSSEYCAASNCAGTIWTFSSCSLFFFPFCSGAPFLSLSLHLYFRRSTSKTRKAAMEHLSTMSGSVQAASRARHACYRAVRISNGKVLRLEAVLLVIMKRGEPVASLSTPTSCKRRPAETGRRRSGKQHCCTQVSGGRQTNERREKARCFLSLCSCFSVHLSVSRLTAFVFGVYSSLWSGVCNSKCGLSRLTWQIRPPQPL